MSSHNQLQPFGRGTVNNRGGGDSFQYCKLSRGHLFVPELSQKSHSTRVETKQQNTSTENDWIWPAAQHCSTGLMPMTTYQVASDS